MKISDLWTETDGSLCPVRIMVIAAACAMIYKFSITLSGAPDYQGFAIGIGAITAGISAKHFVEKQTDWLRRQIQRMAAKPVSNRAWQIGSEILFRGEVVTIAAGVEEKSSITFADQTVQLSRED